MSSCSFQKKKQPPKTPSQSEQQSAVEQQLSRYTCTLDKSASEQARNLGLEKGKTVCSLVDTAVSRYINEKRQPKSAAE